MAQVVAAFIIVALISVASAQYGGYEKSEPDYYDPHPKYKFEYSVHDPHTHDIKSQKEERDGDVVHGSYELVEADGSKRVVQYTADHKNGFNAVVHREHNIHPIYEEKPKTYQEEEVSKIEYKPLFEVPKYELLKYELPKYEEPKYEEPKYKYEPKHQEPKYEYKPLYKPALSSYYKTKPVYKYEDHKIEAPKYDEPKYGEKKYSHSSIYTPHYSSKY